MSAALPLDLRALARAEGVQTARLEEWALSQPGTGARSEATAAGVAPKAWRFAGEMREIAAASEGVGLPAGFGLAAAALDERLAALKDSDAVELDDVLRELLS